MDHDLDSADGYTIVETRRAALRVDRIQDFYYKSAFTAFSGLAMKDILDAWISSCCPTKQTRYPYNGGELAQKSMTEYQYEGHYTKPPFWPPDAGWNDPEGVRGCRHRSVHHLKKPGILRLYNKILA